MIDQRFVLMVVVCCFVVFDTAHSFQTTARLGPAAGTGTAAAARRNAPRLEAATEDADSAETTTEKYGLEAGLAQAAKEGDGESAKSLLKKYGIAYLATSIPLALASFTACYFLVDNGVDVGSLLEKVGIDGSGAADKAGTVAIAYAAHKAASPIRFPPTVLLTPVVAKMIGTEPDEAGTE
eukprot:CAMPEP_0201124092 /NCGR_PEP_ID=MMETSP0850-20130426/10554_1 /ASSEMBLY_ACC=CAM_ASM_000622 /TAXON_ID=183588 /ORGANISM="Pseudo-nitzschia fraudulenta, Strain WWA7" /LENGTH=180 /DNA_ID=CAMNT_0047391285 /DNA_START=139 /DNA_END=681 /DNA_ORIENTATION=-